ncbi:hypothetical protein [Limosilactobacillus coleohominis]|uniref:hypothetical protein n=1 Tax=Limosilactobacillus coleohominis TaxID=181675 RepID=UPI00195D55B2|nr:hypothetical protein [Limosilactobacillus coleohominis]MBM6954376.1 hypothetical protein [Limosilactobacillus coleohominis]
MRKRQRKRPIYRRPWVWITILALLVGGSWWGIDQRTSTETQDDAVVKTIKESSNKKKRAPKKSSRKKQSQTGTSSEVSPQRSTNSSLNNGTQNSGVDTQKEPSGGNQNSSSLKEPWIDPDNYEPNSIIGDRSTMYCYLPGQSPYPPIAPENIVYFNSLAEAHAAGYNTVQ